MEPLAVPMFNGTTSNLRLLVEELLLARTEGLEPRELAAFVDGWTSLLELVGRTDLAIPGASPEVRERVEELVDAIRDAQARVLAEESSS